MTSCTGSHSNMRVLWCWLLLDGIRGFHVTVNSRISYQKRRLIASLVEGRRRSLDDDFWDGTSGQPNAFSPPPVSTGSPYKDDDYEIKYKDDYEDEDAIKYKADFEDDYEKPYYVEEANTLYREKERYTNGDTTSSESTSYAKIVDKVEWESIKTDAGTVHVVLPPTSVLRPTAIIHFCGGTFFGSAPNIWYRKLMEDVVKHTDAVVVASTIPVTLLQSPLQHVSLSRQIQRQFHTAYREILLDEYTESVHQVPVCAMGHSLGARLLVVLSTLPPLPTRPFTPHEYKSFILMSFTNFGAAAGIPGLYQLNKASRKVEQSVRQQEPRRRRERYDRRDYNNDWEDDDEEEEWEDMLVELQQTIQNQASRVRTALTPNSRDLEFYPTPTQLWKALDEDQRYAVNTTLFVQFDNDPVDQTSKLATILRDSTSGSFARLRGTHLTPVTAPSGGIQNSLLQRLFGNKNEHDLLILRQSICRYLKEVVCS